MNNKIFTPGEILTIQTNLNEIEKNLGHPIPGGYIDSSDLKDRILRPGEIATVCQNVRNVQKPYSRRYSGRVGDVDSFVTLTLLVVGAICFFSNFFLGIDLLWWTH